MATKQFVSSFARFVLTLFVLAMPLVARADGDFTVIRIKDIRVGDGEDYWEKEMPDGSFRNPRVFEFQVSEDLDTRNFGYLTFESKAVEGNFNEIYLNPPPGFSCQDDFTDVNNDFAVGFVNPHHGHPGEWFPNFKAFQSGRLQPGTLCADGCAVGTCFSGPSRPGARRCVNQLVFCSRDGHAQVADVDDFGIRQIILHFKRDRLQ